MKHDRRRQEVGGRWRHGMGAAAGLASTSSGYDPGHWLPILMTQLAMMQSWLAGWLAGY